MERTLIRQLLQEDELHDRVLRLMTIPAVGPVTALTWALEIGDVSRFRSLKQVISYAGLSADECSSGEKQYRMPLSKKCNKHLKMVLIEAARIAPYWNPELNAIYQRECERGHRNRAALAVARKIAGYLLAVDRRETGFVVNLSTAEQPAA
ncbi:MAG TPA: IS110 family transposase [Terriglobales bacterium]|nr:IS110 family transposase [Terriglobales bacterium]